jgi:hypothetical protein
VAEGDAAAPVEPKYLIMSAVTLGTERFPQAPDPTHQRAMGNAEIWRALEEVRGLCAATVTWRRHLGNSFELVASMFMRRLEESAESIWCEECYCAHTVVTHANGTRVGVCECDPWNCDDMHLSADDVALWEVNWTKLGRAVASAFDCEWRETDLGVPWTRQIGTWSSAAVPVILTLQSQPAEFRKAVTDLVARFRAPFILLAPTLRWRDAVCLERLASVAAKGFDLASHVTFGPRGTLQVLKRPAELFAGFAPEPKQPVPEEVAQQVFVMVQRLHGERPYRTAPLISVFLLYCKEGLSAEESARKLGCSKALIVLRLKELREELGRHPAELRQLSSHFEGTEDSLTDFRARKIYRRGLTYDGTVEE